MARPYSLPPFRTGLSAVGARRTILPPDKQHAQVICVHTLPFRHCGEQGYERLFAPEKTGLHPIVPQDCKRAGLKFGDVEIICERAASLVGISPPIHENFLIHSNQIATEIITVE